MVSKRERAAAVLFLRRALLRRLIRATLLLGGCVGTFITIVGSCSGSGPSPEQGHAVGIAVIHQALTLADAQTLCAPYPGTHIIFGTDGNDTLDGTNQADCIVAGAGKDKIKAGNGDDIVFAGDGDDDITGDNGNDTLFAGAGNDRALGGNGNDTLRGDDGSDFLNGESGDDQLFGGAGDDEIYGDNGNDVVFAGAGNDRLYGGNGDDALHGEDGADRLSGDNGNDTMLGDACHDRMIASSGTDTKNGGTGVDACSGSNCELPETSTACVRDADCAAAQRCVITSGVCVANSAERCRRRTGRRRLHVLTVPS
jgi:hypothetical protein